MSEGNKKAADGAALWGRARSSTLSALADQWASEWPDIDESDLAGYLDGTMEAAAAARVEGALAHDADRLELLIAAREALQAGPAQAPEDLVARAQALVSHDSVNGPHPPAEAWAGRLSGWLAGHLGPLLDPRRGLAFAGVAAGFLMICVAGFELGRAEVVYSAQVDSLLAQEFTGLIGRDGEDLL